MEMDYSKFKEAASGGTKAPETTGDGLSDLESALDQIQRAKQMERRLQDEVGPSLSEQVLELAQDPKIQRAAREIGTGRRGPLRRLQADRRTGPATAPTGAR